MTNAPKLEKKKNVDASAKPSAGLFLGLVAGALAVVPALARGGGLGLLGVALCSMALAAPVCLGLRTVGASWLTWLALSLAAAFAPLAFGAEWLVRTTHHRPLGAVTFAVLAWVLLASVALLARRFLARVPDRASLARGLLLAFALLDILLLVRSRSSGALEAAAWLTLVFLASLMPTSVLRGLPSARVQGVVWLVTLLVAAVWTLGAPDSLSQASAVLSFPMRALLGRA